MKLTKNLIFLLSILILTCNFALANDQSCIIEKINKNNKLSVISECVKNIDYHGKSFKNFCNDYNFTLTKIKSDGESSRLAAECPTDLKPVAMCDLTRPYGVIRYFYQLNSNNAKHEQESCEEEGDWTTDLKKSTAN